MDRAHQTGAVTELHRVFRLWLGLTTLFLGLATAVVSGVLFYRTQWLENELRDFHRRQLESRFREDHYNRISEELFLGLDNLATREAALSSLLGGAGAVHLKLVPNAVGKEPARRALEPMPWRLTGNGRDEAFAVPLYFSDVYLGTLHLTLGWRESTVFHDLILTLCVLLALLGVVWLVTVLGIQRRIFAPLLERMMRMSYSAAVAQTTQMLAHDIRAPFSTMWAGLKLLGEARNASEIQTLLFKLLPQVEKQIRVVDGMITDILEIGTSKEVSRSPVSADSLVESALSDVFRIHKDADIAIGYQPGHRHLLSVDGLAVMRVLSNILENAVQAEGKQGRIWIRTTETDGWMELCIGNASSFIDEEDLSKLFDPFFTKGKRRGTGLGLAIAQKVVHQHGGRIGCRSRRGEGTEFYFTLPIAADFPATEHARLPASSKLFAVAWKTLDPVLEAGVESELLKELAASPAPLKLLAVDDESLYLEGVKALVRQDRQLVDRVTLHDARTCDDAFAVARAERPDLILCDIDLGPASADGITLVERLRAEGLPAYICVHSNRRFDEDRTCALEAGADAFFPKPVSHAHLVQLLLEAARRRGKALPGTDAGTGGDRPLVAVVDDNDFVLEAWTSSLKDARVRTFTGPSQFWRAVEAEPRLIEQLACVVSDLYFDEDEPEDGASFLRRLRTRTAVPAVLATDSPKSGGEISLEGLARIDKAPRSWAELRRDLPG